MSSTKRSAQAVVPLDGAPRLEAFEWDEVHDAVNSALQTLDSELAKLVPDSSVQGGRNSGKSWDLFTYRVYQLRTHSDIDPVVVGLTFQQDARGVVSISGDISGETLGDVLLTVPGQLAAGKSPVIQTARMMAEALASQAAIIAQALGDSKRSV